MWEKGGNSPGTSTAGPATGVRTERFCSALTLSQVLEFFFSSGSSYMVPNVNSKFRILVLKPYQTQS